MPPMRNSPSPPPSRRHPSLGIFQPRPSPPVDHQAQVKKQKILDRLFPRPPEPTGQDSSGYAAWAAQKPIAIHLEGDLKNVGKTWSDLELANYLPSLRLARENTVQAATWYLKHGPRWGPGREVMEVLLRQPMLIFMIYVREVAPALRKLAKKQQRAARKEQKYAARKKNEIAKQLRQQRKRLGAKWKDYESPCHTEKKKKKKSSNMDETTYGQMFLAQAEILIDWVAVDESLINSPEQRACRCQIWNEGNQIPEHSPLAAPFPGRAVRCCSSLNMLTVTNPFVNGKEYTAAADESTLIITRRPIRATPPYAVNASCLNTTPLFAVTPVDIDPDIARQIREFREACLLGNDPYETQRALTLLMSRKKQRASAAQ